MTRVNVHFRMVAGTALYHSKVLEDVGIETAELNTKKQHKSLNYNLHLTYIDTFYIHINHLFPQQTNRLGTRPQPTTNLTSRRLSDPGNILTYNAVISACHSGAQWQRALEFLADLQRFYVESNSYLGSVRLFGLFGSGSNPVGLGGMGLVGGLVWGLLMDIHPWGRQCWSLFWWNSCIRDKMFDIFWQQLFWYDPYDHVSLVMFLCTWICKWIDLTKDHLQCCFERMWQPRSMGNSDAFSLGGLILLMVQKSGDHQLRLVVYATIYSVLHIPGG